MAISPRVFLAVVLLSVTALAQSNPQSETEEPVYTEQELLDVRRDAEQGSADAQVLLGFMHHRGKSVPQSYTEAAKWYRKAAEQENAKAQAFLGVLYYSGQGVPQDYLEAVKWYRKAAEQGDADAQGRLGALYVEGKGVPLDYVEAARWVRKAAEQGNADAQILLGALYFAGRGVPQDYIQAHMWANLATAGSTGEDAQKEGAELRNDIAARMTPEQIAEAQRLAREWKPITAK